VTADELVLDSDTLDGGQARPVSTRAALTVDPRPVPEYTGEDAAHRFDNTVSALINYRLGLGMAECLRELDQEVPVQRGPLGIPVVDWNSSLQTDCLKEVGGHWPREAQRELEIRLFGEYQDCGTQESGIERQVPEFTEENGAASYGLGASAQDPFCLQRAFQAMDPAQHPEPLTLSLGTGDEVRADPIDLWPALIAAAIVALVAIVGTALMSRRVLRPVVKLTAAARQLGDGDLAERVPVRGRDQLAELATSFNRMAASLQASKEQQRTMVGDIAHELRTPLANIRGYLEALKDGVLAPDPALFQSLHEEAVLQQRLIDDLQDLAEAESGTMIYHRARLDVAELLSTSRTAHLAAAEARGVRLITMVHGDPVINGDADRLRQVIGNLITNALRATAPGGTVTLRTQSQPDAVYVAVADTGHGITADDLPHVFDRFWRADNARSRTTGGSGLGLAIAREIVAAHQGSMTVTSTIGKGTVFTMRFPVA